MPRTADSAKPRPAERWLGYATALLLGAVAAAAWQGSWPEHEARARSQFVDRFFPFDAAWYQRIATAGYLWDPAHPELKQDVAFCPLWPLALGLIGVLASSRLAARPVLLQGIFAMALFIWFHSSTRPGNSKLRLTYCTIGMFLGLAWLLRNRPKLTACVIAASAMMLASGAFLTDAGYHVV
jgi:hypothetical protein